MKTPSLRNLSIAISWVLHPCLLPIYLVALLFVFTAFAHYSANIRIYISGVVLLYTIIIPVLSLRMLRSLRTRIDFRIGRYRQQVLPLLIGVICYTLCAVTIAKIPSAIFIRKVMIAAALCQSLCLLISSRYKIDRHLMGMGALTAVFIVLNIIGVGEMFAALLGGILCTGLLASAHLYLGRHNPAQLLVGFVSGFILAFIALLLL